MERMISCEALLFDLDGVLVESTAIIERYWRRWAAAHGLDGAAVVRAAHGRRSVETVRLVAPHLDAEAEALRLAAGAGTDTEGLVRVDGAAALTRRLPPDAWAVVTSGMRPTATTRLAFAGVPVPAVLVTADDVARGKPDPEGYLLAAARLGCAPEDCVVVEDAPVGIEAAHAAGMRVIAVTTTHPPEALRAAEAVVAGLAALTVRPAPARPKLTVTVARTAA